MQVRRVVSKVASQRGRVLVAFGLLGFFVGGSAVSASATWTSSPSSGNGGTIQTASLQAPVSPSGSVIPGAVPSASWSFSSPSAVSGTSVLEDVSCPSTSMCWAVGYDSSSGGGVVTEWTASSGWGAVSTVSAGSGTTYLYGVSCP